MPLSVLKDIRKIYAGLNAGGISQAAARQVSVGLVATSEDVYGDMEDFLAPPHIDALHAGAGPAQHSAA